MFEQKINTVSIRVNEESFAVVPFDNYKDAVQAAKQALVALNAGDAMESLIDRLCRVEMALAEEKARNTAMIRIDENSISKAMAKDGVEKIKALNERIVDPNSNEIRGRIIPVNFDFVGALFDAIPRNQSPLEAMGKRIETLEKVVEMLREGVDRPHKRKETGSHERCQPLAPDSWLTWGYQDDGLPMVTTMNVDVVNEWIKEGKKVFEVQKKPINY